MLPFLFALATSGAAVVLPDVVEVGDVEHLPWFSYSALGTANATVGTTNQRKVGVQAGTSIRVGTCGLPEAHTSGRTKLRLWNITKNVEITDFRVSTCGLLTTRGNVGAQINYTVPYDMTIEVRAGCVGDTACSGDVAWRQYLDATPRLYNVKWAFTQILQSNATLSKSPDSDGWISGVQFQKHSYDGKYHVQGIARTYNRAYHDIVTSVAIDREIAQPENRNLFFSKLDTKLVSRSDRFGSNAPYTSDDRVRYGINSGDYSYGEDVDGAPIALDHAGGLQAIGNYVLVPSEYVDVDGAPPNASQVVAFDISQQQPEPRLLIARKTTGSGWVAATKLPNIESTTFPAMLRGGYLFAVPHQNRISLYVQAADGCTGFASLAKVIPYTGEPRTVPDRSCPINASHSPDTVDDKRPIELVGCMFRSGNEDECPLLRTMYEDGESLSFPNQDDVQSANLFTQADGTVFLMAFEGFNDFDLEWGSNSEVQLWRVVFGTRLGMTAEQAALYDGTTCDDFVCLVRAGKKDDKDSYKNMHTTEIDGNMFRYGGGAYIAPSSNPNLEKILVYGTEHYIQKSPQALLWNEF